MDAHPQSQAELEQHLAEHLEFLASSAEAYDAGRTGEAKRLAVSLRVLLHDSRNSHSLMGQLNRLGAQFLSTAIPHEPRSIATHGGLIVTAASGHRAEYRAPLDDAPTSRWLAFQEWWNEIVFADSKRQTLSRKSLILAVANQDGGAHVDPQLNEIYARLSRHNSLAWTQHPAGIPIPNPERAAIRQIAHETLKTFVPGYEKRMDRNAEMFFSGVTIVEGAHVPPIQRGPKVGRNEPCPCGSGKKYKRCHGAV